MAPRSEEQNAAIKDERREQILSAALRVFATKGFAAAKISDIVEKGGISHGLLYHYFESKEDIFTELLKRAVDTASETILMMEHMPVSPLEKVRKTAEVILGSIADFEESAYYFLIVIHAAVMEGLDEEKKAYTNASTATETMVRILSEGQKAGEVRGGDPEQMAAVFFSAITGLAMERLMVRDFQMPDPEILVNLVVK
jgi:AcrR family transcriptional regulator